MTPISCNSSEEGDTNGNEPHGTADDLIFGFISHSLRENDYEAFEKGLTAGDAALTSAIKGWGIVIEELSLAMPPITPDPGILGSLLARIESQEEPASLVDPGVESADAHALLPADATLTAGDSKQKPLIIRRGTQPGWRSAGSPGAKIRILNFDRRQGRTTYLLQIDAGSSYPEHVHHADEECFVISGDIHDGELSFAPGDYFLAPAGSHHGTLTTIEGCVCLITTAIPIKV